MSTRSSHSTAKMRSLGDGGNDKTASILTVVGRLWTTRWSRGTDVPYSPCDRALSSSLISTKPGVPGTAQPAVHVDRTHTATRPAPQRSSARRPQETSRLADTLSSGRPAQHDEAGESVRVTRVASLPSPFTATAPQPTTRSSKLVTRSSVSPPLPRSPSPPRPAASAPGTCAASRSRLHRRRSRPPARPSARSRGCGSPVCRRGRRRRVAPKAR